MTSCPVCSLPIISPSGNPNSTILLIGEFPGDEEMKVGLPFVGKAGHVLRQEFYREKVDYKRLRITNLWLHPKHTAASRKKEDQKLAAELNENCLKYFMECLLKEANGKKAILLIGSDAVKTLTGKSVSAWAGLRMTSDYLDPPLLMCSVNPASVYHVPLGETRLSIHKFVREMKRAGYYE